jgi:hypothetical protein
MEKSFKPSGSGGWKPRALVWLMGAMLVLLSGCAPGMYRAGEPPRAYPKYFDKPTGPGTVPPSWYDYDPALEQWYDPWYVNPYQQ